MFIWTHWVDLSVLCNVDITFYFNIRFHCVQDPIFDSLFLRCLIIMLIRFSCNTFGGAAIHTILCVNVV